MKSLVEQKVCGQINSVFTFDWRINEHILPEKQFINI